MNYLRKHKKPLIVLSSLLMVCCSAIGISQSNALETKAESSRAFIAIDSRQGIGYLASQLYDFMKMTNYFAEVDRYEDRENTIFLQHEFQGSESYLSDIKTILVVDKVKIDNCKFLFKGLENLEEIVDIGNLDVSMSPDFQYMFEDCPKLKSIDFKNFDVSNCPNLSFMFCNSSFETLDLSSFDTSNVGDFERMFSYCTNLTSLDVSSFNTKIASNMEYMFHYCPLLSYLDISSFDLSNSPRVDEIFYGTDPKIIVGPKCVPEQRFDNTVYFYLPMMTDVPFYYYDCYLNTYTSIPQTNSSTTFYHESLVNIAANYCQSYYRALDSMEYIEEQGLDHLINVWEAMSDLHLSFTEDENERKGISEILSKCSTDTCKEDINNLLVLYEEVYEKYCHVLTDVGGDFLNRCPNALDADGLIHIGVDTVNNIGYIAPYDTYEILESNVKTAVEFPAGGVSDSIFSLLGSDAYESVTKVVIQDDINIHNCRNLFKGLENVTSIEGIENINTELNNSCVSMFEDCVSLETIDLKEFDTDGVITADYMFKNCSSLVEINSLAFASKSLVSMLEMFYGCSNLSLLDLSRFDLTNVNNSIDCFNNATFFYLKTPLCMPSKSTCEFNFYIPYTPGGFNYYDISFNTLTALPKVNSSTLIISEYGKGVLDNLCDGFIKDCEYYCVSDGSTSEASLIKLWEYQSEDFSKRLSGTTSECLMEFLKKDNSSSVDAKLKSFSEKYDYIYGKYQTLLDDHGGDFAQRSSLIVFANNSPLIPYLTKSNNVVLIILIITSVNLGLFLYVFLRKRKVTK